VSRTDVGQYNCIEIATDCPSCSVTIHTFTLVMIVSALNPEAARARAGRIVPTSAEVVPWPETP